LGRRGETETDYEVETGESGKTKENWAGRGWEDSTTCRDLLWGEVMKEGNGER